MGRLDLRLGRFASTATALLGLVGCNGTGTVSGRVTLSGKPLTGGVVMAYDSQNQTFGGMILSDGTYTIVGMATGKVDFAVQTAAPFRRWKGPIRKSAIPVRYSDRTTSGLSIDLKKGDQEMDLALEDEPAGK